jgi:hypothetical protein
MREGYLRHATTTEHLAQFVPAAEATRLFHSYLPALSVGPGRHSCAAGGCRPGLPYPDRIV